MKQIRCSWLLTQNEGHVWLRLSPYADSGRHHFAGEVHSGRSMQAHAAVLSLAQQQRMQLLLRNVKPLPDVIDLDGTDAPLLRFQRPVDRANILKCDGG